LEEIKVAMTYEDSQAQEKARGVVPKEKLEEQARIKLSAGQEGGAAASSPAVFRDILLLEVMEWFSTDFFSWVDTLPCGQCGKPTTGEDARLAATPEELADGATRVEG
jgi:peptide-N4-(N-acetyl-beta-glucosaminyl)asparagine amidase